MATLAYRDISRTSISKQSVLFPPITVVIINGEQALLISHLSSFSIVEADEAVVGTQFQALSIDNIRKNENYVVSLKDVQQVVRNGHNVVWGRLVDPPVNKNRAGLGFSSRNGKRESLNLKSSVNSYHDVFRSRGYLHPIGSGINVVEEVIDEGALEFTQDGQAEFFYHPSKAHHLK